MGIDIKTNYFNAKLKIGHTHTLENTHTQKRSNRIYRICSKDQTTQKHLVN